MKKIIFVIVCLLITGCSVQQEQQVVEQEVIEEKVDLFADLDSLHPMSEKLSGSGTIYDPYLINNADDLMLFNYIMYNAFDFREEYPEFEKAYFKLTDDIYFNDIENYDDWENNPPAYEWFPIGSEDYSEIFGGNFDGDGHSINGLYIKNEDLNYVGLFSMILHGKVTNLTISNSLYLNYYNEGESVNMGAIAGESSNSVFDNCSSEVKFIGINKFDFIGGIVGELYNGTIENCNFSGDINTDGYAAGILADGASIVVKNCINDGLLNATNSAGIINQIHGGGNEKYDENSKLFETLEEDEKIEFTTKIENCVNNSNVNFAGIISELLIFDNAKVILKDLHNNGKIQNDIGNVIDGFGTFGRVCVYANGSLIVDNITNDGEINGNNVGGIFGILEINEDVVEPSEKNDSATISIKNCVNNGSITSEDSVGGIINNLNIRSSSNKEITIQDCINNGEIIGKEYVGGVISNFDFYGDEGSSTTFTVERCQNNAEITGNSVGGIIGGRYIGRDKSKSVITVDSCENNGNIKGVGDFINAGGIVGYYVAGDGKQVIKNCQNKGDITIPSKNIKYYAGGIVALLEEPAVVEDSENTGSLLIYDSETSINLSNIGHKLKRDTIPTYE